MRGGEILAAVMSFEASPRPREWLPYTTAGTTGYTVRTIKLLYSEFNANPTFGADSNTEVARRPTQPSHIVAIHDYGETTAFAVHRDGAAPGRTLRTRRARPPAFAGACSVDDV